MIKEFSYEYFCEEFHRFMEMMGTKGYSIENRMNGFKGLALVALRCKDSRAAHFLKVASIDYERRMKYLI